MRATLVCVRPPTGHGDGADNRWTDLPDFEAGLAALERSTPTCGPRCTGVHFLAYADETGDTHVIGTPVEQVPLEVELKRLYPRRIYDVSPARWPVPAELNETLDRPQNPSPLPEKQERGALLRATAVVPEIQPPISTLLDDLPPPGTPVPHAQPRRRWADYPPLPLPPMPRPHDTERRIERFWSKVEKTDGCWLWKAGTSGGYGRFFDGVESVAAQKFAWELTEGLIPEGLELGRRNGCPKTCVRPEHWRVATHREIAAHAAANPSPEDRRWRQRQTRGCLVEGCTNKHLAHDLCTVHYHQNRRQPCPSPSEPEKPALTPMSASSPAVMPSPMGWRERWQQKPAPGWPTRLPSRT